jgi:sigma-B regulation protein RsbU (phosphoserine phosphatase)
MTKINARPVRAGIKWRHRISVRLSTIFSFFSMLIFGMTLGYNYYQTRHMITVEMEMKAQNIVTAAAGRVETAIVSVAALTESMARSLETFPYTEAELLDFIKTSVLFHPDVFGSAVAFEPYPDSRFQGPYAPYFYRTPNGTGYVDLAQSYDYPSQDWFQIPRELEETEWSEPYYDEGGGNILMATCSVPFYETQNGERRFAGIVTADISLKRLTDIVSSIQVLKTGFGFLLSRNGTVLAHPQQELIMNESLFSIAEARGSSELRNIARGMVAGKSGFIPYETISGVQSYMCYAPLRSVDWTLGVIFPEDELFADIRTLTMTMAGLGLSAILLLMAVVVLVAKSITTPIRALAAASEKIAAGDFDARLPSIRLKDEVGFLTRDFRVMRDSLKEHVARLMETTAARERMESELKIAHDIQMSILPKTFPPFPTREEFDLFALIVPAREVGGDFYDFFQLRENLLCFVIGDVSGKGVPAALFMAVTKTLIKSFAREDVAPDAILSHVNEELAAENDACMFVTLFCGILDTETGEIRYANAGHNPPLVVKKSGAVKWLPRAGSLVAGAMPGVCYECERFRLSPGDSLFLYTDGVTEAMNHTEDLFSEKRLEKDLEVSAGMGIKDAIGNIMDSILRFSGGAPQSDDITMMMIRYSGNEKA